MKEFDKTVKRINKNIREFEREKLRGAPKKDPMDVKENRTVRASDNDIDFVMLKTNLSLQGFVDLQIAKLKKGKIK